MSDEISPKTLDLAEVFSGRAFPKDVLPVYLDEVTAYRVHKINKEITQAVIRNDNDRATELADELTELTRESAKKRYEIHLTGVSRADRKVVLDEVTEKFPIELDAFGRVKSNPEADALLTNLTWKLYVEKIVGPDGSELIPTLEDIIIFRAQAPDAVLEQIKNAMDELSEGVKSGFETIAQEHDFLSSASPEA